MTKFEKLEFYCLISKMNFTMSYTSNLLIVLVRHKTFQLH